MEETMKKKNGIKITVLSILAAVFVAAAFFLFSLGRDSQIYYAHMPTVLADAPSTVAMTYLQEEGITSIPFFTGPETAKALMSGHAFVATFAELPFLLASAERDDLRVIAVITSANSMGILADSSAGINNPEDLKGKKMGLPIGTSAHYLSNSYFQKINSSPSIVNLPPPQLQSALERGDVQAIAIWQPFLERTRLENPDRFFYLENSQEEFKVIMLIVSTEQNINNHPDKIETVLRGLIQAEKAIAHKSPDIMKKIETATGLDNKTLESILPFFEFKVKLDREIIETWEMLSEWAYNERMINEEVMQRNWSSFVYKEGLEKIDPGRVDI